MIQKKTSILKGKSQRRPLRFVAAAISMSDVRPEAHHHTGMVILSTERAVHVVPHPQRRLRSLP